MTSKLQETTTPVDAAKESGNAASSPEATQPDVNRRLMLGAGLVGLAAILASACSGSNFSSGSKSADKAKDKAKADAGDGDDDDSGSGTPKVPTGGGTDPVKDPLIMPVGSEKNAKDLLPPGTKIQGGTSDNPSVASFDPKTGVIKAIAPGTAVITIQTPDGPKLIYVKVKEPSSSGGSGTGTGPNGGVIGDGGDGGLQTAVDTGADSCYANTVTKLDLSGIPAADAGMKPKVVFYGSTRSTLIAVKFNSDLPLKQLVITKESGELLALHGITGADKNGSGWRPIVIDNIWLGDATKIVLVLQLDGDVRKKVEVDVEYFKTFQGKAVVDLSAMSVPGGFVGNQAIASFDSASGFQEDPNAKYPNKYNLGSDRLLQTAQAGASWTMKADIMNPGNKYTFTDVMGDVININGAGILEYQVFCAYAINGNSAYRTMLHVG